MRELLELLGLVILANLVLPVGFIFMGVWLGWWAI